MKLRLITLFFPLAVLLLGGNVAFKEVANPPKSTVKKFVLYDAMFYSGKPDLTSAGFSRIKLLYETKLTKPDPTDNTKVILDMNKINTQAEVADSSNFTVVCTDIEQWYGDSSVGGEEMANRFTIMFKVFRDKIKNVKISNYGIPTTALCLSRYYDNGKTDEETLINKWRAKNEKRWACANTVDFFAPSVYIGGPNVESWINDLKITVKEIKAHDAAKKIIVFLWPQYYDKKDSPYYKKFIAPEIWQQMLEAVYENCDGAIIWSGATDENEQKVTWDDSRVQAMMNVTKQFIDSHKENKDVLIK
jgi:hypothetical protein